MKINLEEGKVKCYERKNIGTLGRVGRELSDNTKTPQPLRRFRHPESDRTSAYQRNIWIVTKGKTSDRSAELGTSCPIMQKRRGHCAESDVRSPTAVRRISEKYLTCNKRKTSGHLPKLGARCPIMQSVASLAQSWTSGVRPDVCGMLEKYLSRNTIACSTIGKLSTLWVVRRYLWVLISHPFPSVSQFTTYYIHKR